MRFSLPILLLTTAAALAQPAPDKPFINDGPGPNSFTPPNPAIIEPAPAQAEKPAPQAQSGAPAAAPHIDGLRTEKLCSFDNPPPCQKPEPARPSAKSVG